MTWSIPRFPRNAMCRSRADVSRRVVGHVSAMGAGRETMVWWLLSHGLYHLGLSPCGRPWALKARDPSMLCIRMLNTCWNTLKITMIYIYTHIHMYTFLLIFRIYDPIKGLTGFHPLWIATHYRSTLRVTFPNTAASCPTPTWPVLERRVVILGPLISIASCGHFLPHLARTRG